MSFNSKLLGIVGCDSRAKGKIGYSSSTPQADSSFNHGARSVVISTGSRPGIVTATLKSNNICKFILEE